MAFGYDVNNTPANGSEAFFDFKELIKLQGWPITKSGDGLALFSAVGDVITTPAAGAGGMANTRAWFAAQRPGGPGSPEMVFQRGTLNTTWRAKVSPQAGFVGGTPDADETPSALDEQPWMGGGSDAVPTFATFFGADGGTYRWNMGADDAAPFGFWANAFPLGGGIPGATLVFEPMAAQVPGDVFPYVCIMGVNGNGLFQQAQGLSTEANGNTVIEKRLSWVANTPAVGAAADFTGNSFGPLTVGLATVPSALSVNPITLKTSVFPIPFARSTRIPNPGWKGASTVLKWNGTLWSTGTLLDTVAPGDRVVLGVVSVPWPTGVGIVV